MKKMGKMGIATVALVAFTLGHGHGSAASTDSAIVPREAQSVGADAPSLLEKLPDFTQTTNPAWKITPERQAELDTRWKNAQNAKNTPEARFYALVEILTEIHPALAAPGPDFNLSEATAGLPADLDAQVRLWYAIQMTRSGRLELAEAAFASLPPQSTLAPGLYIFYRAVAQHQLLQTEACLETITQASLLPQTSQPRRFLSLLKLMKLDLESLKSDSLEFISRRMRGVERRLTLGVSGEPTQNEQKEIIDALDKMIEELEKQQQKSQSRSSARRPSGKPANDARVMGGSGPGNVDLKRLDPGDAWGNLPPREREDALQTIGHDFPPHYRDVIEQFFIQMSQEEGPQ